VGHNDDKKDKASIEVIGVPILLEDQHGLMWIRFSPPAALEGPPRGPEGEKEDRGLDKNKIRVLFLFEPLSSAPLVRGYGNLPYCFQSLGFFYVLAVK